jgi:arginine deiminase
MSLATFSVMRCISLKRLTPSNYKELLFEDVLWVKKACW